MFEVKNDKYFNRGIDKCYGYLEKVWLLIIVVLM